MWPPKHKEACPWLARASPFSTVPLQMAPNKGCRKWSYPLVACVAFCQLPKMFDLSSLHSLFDATISPPNPEFRAPCAPRRGMWHLPCHLREQERLCRDPPSPNSRTAFHDPALPTLGKALASWRQMAPMVGKGASGWHGTRGCLAKNTSIQNALLNAYDVLMSFWTSARRGLIYLNCTIATSLCSEKHPKYCVICEQFQKQIFSNITTTLHADHMDLSERFYV